MVPEGETSDPPTVTMIGFGEAGAAFAPELVDRARLCAFDLKTADPQTAAPQWES